MLNPVHLRTLATVIRLGSFADAARQLGYTGSAVSQQISALERQLKVTLFERDAHSVRPTPAAIEIAARSAGALGALQGLEDDIARIVTGMVGRLRIGSFPTASEQLLPAALTRLQRVRPHLDIHLDEDEPVNLVPMLARREIDVALLYRYQGIASRWPAPLVLRPLLVEEFLLIRPDRESPGPTEPAETDLVSQMDATWISTKETTSGAVTMRQLCRAAGFDPQVSFRSNNYAVIQGLVAAGLGTALIPAMAYAPRPGLSAARLSGVPASREVLVASAPSTPEVLADVFESAMRRSAEKFARDRPGVRLLDR